MRRISKKQLVISSVVLWVIAAVILGGSWVRDISLPGIERWLLLPLGLLIKDTLLYGYEHQPMSSKLVVRKKVLHDRDTKKRTRWYPPVLANRKYIFPVLLTVYLLYLLIEQTGLRGWQYSIAFLALDSDLLLVLVIISGILLVFGESYDELYEQQKNSHRLAWAYVLLSIVLSIVGAYVVLQQVLDLGLLGIVIANIAGYIIFLVGLVLLDDEESSEIVVKGGEK